MKGNWIFLSLGGFLGVLASLKGAFYLFLFILYLLFLWLLRKFTVKQFFIVVALFLFLFSRGMLENHMNETVLTGDEKNFVIQFDQSIKVDGDSFSAYGMDIRTKEQLVLFYRIPTLAEKEKLLNVPPGLACPIKGQLEEPRRASNPNAFDYNRYLHYEKIHWILTIDEMNMEQCVKKVNPIIMLHQLRYKGITYLHGNFPPHTAPLAAALIFGNRDYIEQDLLTAYQKLGIVHLLAISGLHVGMLIGILYYSCLRIGISREKIVNILILFLPMYILLTGGAPSVIRACLMMLLALTLMKWKNMKLMPIDILSIVFLLYLTFQPYAIFHVGFQLSFLVTFSLILSSQILIRFYHRTFLLIMMTSFIAQLASIPVLLYHFYEISIISIFANTFYIPLFSMMILPALFVLFFSHLLLGNMINPILSFFDFYVRIINDIALFLSELSFSTLVLGRPSMMMLFVYIVGLPFVHYLWEKSQNRKSVTFAFFLLLSLVAIHFSSGNLHGKITFIDVGQGDSILIELPKNKGTYLIDTGGTLQFPVEEWKERSDPFEVGRDVLVPLLKSKGIRTIDKLILTHGDMDHIGGAFAVLDSIYVSEVVLPNTKESSALEKEIISICEEKNIPIYFAKKGDSWKKGEYKFTVLSPEQNERGERNDLSVVLYFQLAGFDWLMTGDLEDNGEKTLMRNYPNLSVDILKVGHHGSNSSTKEEFLAQLKPRIAVISAGKDNRFGHPHQKVIERLENKNIHIFRTDEDGAITFQFKGNKGTFFTERHSIDQKK